LGPGRGVGHADGGAGVGACPGGGSRMGWLRWHGC
jgi:hypothetical protein